MGRPLVVVDYSRLLTQHKHAADGALIELRTLRDLQHVPNVDSNKVPNCIGQHRRIIGIMWHLSITEAGDLFVEGSLDYKHSRCLRFYM